MYFFSLIMEFQGQIYVFWILLTNNKLVSVYKTSFFFDIHQIWNPPKNNNSLFKCHKSEQKQQM